MEVPQTGKKLRIAIVGGGVAGLTAAHLLDPIHDVTLFERNDYVGGHTNTVVLEDGPDAGTAIDTGFIVLNDPNYPLFNRLLDRLDIARQDSDMTFSYHCEETGFHYAGTGLNGLFADRRNLFRPSFYGMVADVLRFNRAAKRDLATLSDTESISEYVRRNGWGTPLLESYLVPMGAAIWSAPHGRILELPAVSFLRFFKNHGLLDLAQPIWKTVTGGSHNYVRAAVGRLRGRMQTNAAVQSVSRSETGVCLSFDGASPEPFDRVVIATHADEALGLLSDASVEERSLLGAWEYSRNHTLLHTDTSVLPPSKSAWASWNYTRERGQEAGQNVSVTYYMNRLQRLQVQRDYCVTLNRAGAVDERKVVREIHYTHPVYSPASLATQPKLDSLNGVRNTYFCGSYFSFGFHEDAVRSGNEVGRAFGVTL